MHKVTLHISDELYRRALQLARLTSRDVSDVLSDSLDLSLGQFITNEKSVPPVESLPDDQLVALAQSVMNEKQALRMSELAEKRSAEELTELEKQEVNQLFGIYQEGLLRKARAIREAKERGLLNGGGDG